MKKVVLLAFVSIVMTLAVGVGTSHADYGGTGGTVCWILMGQGVDVNNPTACSLP